MIDYFKYEFFSLQGHLENQQQFPNGSAGTITLMPGLTMLPGQFPQNLSEIQPNETGKMEQPSSWGMPDSVQDKQQQHPVSLLDFYLAFIHFN